MLFGRKMKNTKDLQKLLRDIKKRSMRKSATMKKIGAPGLKGRPDGKREEPKPSPDKDGKLRDNPRAPGHFSHYKKNVDQNNPINPNPKPSPVQQAKALAREKVLEPGRRKERGKKYAEGAPSSGGPAGAPSMGKTKMCARDLLKKFREKGSGTLAKDKKPGKPSASASRVAGNSLKKDGPKKKKEAPTLNYGKMNEEYKKKNPGTKPGNTLNYGDLDREYKNQNKPKAARGGGAMKPEQKAPQPKKNNIPEGSALDAIKNRQEFSGGKGLSSTEDKEITPEQAKKMQTKPRAGTKPTNSIKPKKPKA